MREILIVLFGGLPFVCIGIWIGLMIARATYLPTIRYQRRQISFIQRRNDLQVKNAANFAFALGYRGSIIRREKNEI